MAALPCPVLLVLMDCLQV